MSVSSAIDLVIQTGGLIVNDVAGVSNGQPYNKTVITQLNGNAYIGVFNQNGLDLSSNIVFLNDISAGNLNPTEIPNTVQFDASAVFLEPLGAREPQIEITQGGIDSSGVLINAGANFFYTQNIADAIGIDSSINIVVKTNSATPTLVTAYCVAGGGEGGQGFSNSTLIPPPFLTYNAYTGGGGGSGGLAYGENIPITDTAILTATLFSKDGSASLDYYDGTLNYTVNCYAGSPGANGVENIPGLGGAGGTVETTGTTSVILSREGTAGSNGILKSSPLINLIEAEGGSGGTGSPSDLTIGKTSVVFNKGGVTDAPRNTATQGILGGGGAGAYVTIANGGNEVWTNQTLGGVPYFILYFENGSNITISGNGMSYNNSSSIVSGTFSTATTENIEVFINGVAYYIPLFQ